MTPRSSTSASDVRRAGPADALQWVVTLLPSMGASGRACGAHTARSWLAELRHRLLPQQPHVLTQASGYEIDHRETARQLVAHVFVRMER